MSVYGICMFWSCRSSAESVDASTGSDMLRVIVPSFMLKTNDSSCGLVVSGTYPPGETDSAFWLLASGTTGRCASFDAADAVSTSHAVDCVSATRFSLS